MSDELIVIDTPDGIAFASLLALRGAVNLESKGLKRSRRPSALAIARHRLGMPGKPMYTKVLAALDKKIQEMKVAKGILT